MSNKDKLSVYKQLDVKTRVEGASPHRLIQMLFEGALGAIAEAKGYMERDDIQMKGQMIAKAINIMAGLRDSLKLDDAAGSDLPYNLERLYDYMQRRLMEAHVSNDVNVLIEVSELLQTIKSGWDEIAEKVG